MNPHRYTAALAVAAILAVGVASAGAGQRPQGIDVYPSDEAWAALLLVAQPSVAQPLAGDNEVLSGYFEHAAGCDSVASTYLAGDAPLPPDATATVDSAGNVQVAAQFGPSAVIMAATATGACWYTIASQPTLVISGSGVPAAAGFTNVMCASFLGLQIIAADFTNDSGSQFVYVVQGETEGTFSAAVDVGSFAAAVAESVATGSELPPQFVGQLTTTDGGRQVFAGTGASGELIVDFACTPAPPLPF